MQNERLKKIRAQAKLSQREIGELLGVPATTWNNYENNKSKLDITLADKICTEFNVSLEWLLFGRGEMQPVAPQVNESPDGCKRCFELYEKLAKTNELLQESQVQVIELLKENSRLQTKLETLKNERNSTTDNEEPMASAS